jgi:hypothetical protein
MRTRNTPEEREMSPGEVEESPDFGWPDTVTEFVVERLNRLC